MLNYDFDEMIVPKDESVYNLPDLLYKLEQMHPFADAVALPEELFPHWEIPQREKWVKKSGNSDSLITETWPWL